MPAAPSAIRDYSVPGGFEPRDEVRDNRLGGITSRGRFEPRELAAIAERLSLHGSRAIASVPRARRIDVWSEVIDTFLEPRTRERERVLMPLQQSSGLSAEGITEALFVVLGGAAAGPARALADRAMPAAAAEHSGCCGVVLPGNIPAIAVQSLLPALLLGRPVLFKNASAEPWFTPALIDALAAREPALALGFAAVTFPGDDEASFSAAFGGVERLLAYGSGPAVESQRERFGARLLAQGPKASVALVGTDVDLVGTARALARDIALFDQRGCLSVQAVFTDGDPGELADALAWALELESARLPAGPIDRALAAAVQQLRAEAALRQGARRVPVLDLVAGTVLIESELFFRPVPGLRTVRVHGVRELRQALTAFAPWSGRLQGAALSGSAALALAEDLRELGFSRLAPAGELQSVEAGWHNGGVDPLAIFTATEPRLTS
ncbi:MAG: acyl-CoA reductase [Thermoanaerobaculia bacterium]